MPDDLTVFNQSLETFLENRTMTMEKSVRQALARGYCHPGNTNKELDAVLIEAMANEVLKVIHQETARLGVEQ